MLHDVVDDALVNIILQPRITKGMVSDGANETASHFNFRSPELLQRSPELLEISIERRQSYITPSVSDWWRLMSSPMHLQLKWSMQLLGGPSAIVEDRSACFVRYFDGQPWASSPRGPWRRDCSSADVSVSRDYRTFRRRGLHRARCILALQRRCRRHGGRWRSEGESGAPLLCERSFVAQNCCQSPSHRRLTAPSCDRSFPV